MSYFEICQSFDTYAIKIRNKDTQITKMWYDMTYDTSKCVWHVSATVKLSKICLHATLVFVASYLIYKRIIFHFGQMVAELFEIRSKTYISFLTLYSSQAILWGRMSENRTLIYQQSCFNTNFCMIIGYHYHQMWI